MAKKDTGAAHEESEAPPAKENVLLEKALCHIIVEHRRVGIFANCIAVEAVAVERVVQITRRLGRDEDVFVVHKLDACATRTPLGVLVGTPEQCCEGSQDREAVSVLHPRSRKCTSRGVNNST